MSGWESCETHTLKMCFSVAHPDYVHDGGRCVNDVCSDPLAGGCGCRCVDDSSCGWAGPSHLLCMML